MIYGEISNEFIFKMDKEEKDEVDFAFCNCCIGTLDIRSSNAQKSNCKTTWNRIYMPAEAHIYL